MASLNLRQILTKVRGYAKSDEGKQRMSEYLRDCRTQGRAQTAAGDTVVTIDAMCRAAETMIRMLREIARSHRLPESVLAHFDSLTYTQPIPAGKQGDQYRIDLYFEDDLSRPSLMIVSGRRAGQRTGDGIRNIVSLFDTGYSASANVWGTWDGHEDAGVIKSLAERDGAHFMQDAVESFNREWGQVYGAYAIISADPQFYART